MDSQFILKPTEAPVGHMAECLENDFAQKPQSEPDQFLSNMEFD